MAHQAVFNCAKGERSWCEFTNSKQHSAVSHIRLAKNKKDVSVQGELSAL